VGDRVLFGKYSGQTVKVDGEELLVMREEDIMGVIEAFQLFQHTRRYIHGSERSQIRRCRSPSHRQWRQHSG
jgi:hypothetical protein